MREIKTRDTRQFSNTVQLELAIRDIRRYQSAYLKVNNKPILVRWAKGWYAIGTGAYPSFVRPTEFRNMADNLETRVMVEGAR